MKSFVYDDGGREAAGFKGHTGDCVARAIAIASGRPYAEVYGTLANGMGDQRQTRRTKKTGRTAARGVSTRRKWFKEYMTKLGFKWTPTMKVGQGCRVHLKPEELPQGRLVVAVSRHYVAMIDGVIHDTHDPTRGGNRCVYGYWSV